MTSSGRGFGRVPKFREFSLKQLHQVQAAPIPAPGWKRSGRAAAPGWPLSQIEESGPLLSSDAIAGHLIAQAATSPRCGAP